MSLAPTDPTEKLPGAFAHSAAYPLFQLDLAAGSAQVLHFEPGDYRRAAFLDQRALGHRRIGGWTVGVAEVEARVAAAAAPALPVHWLFHIGHCGSSLVSRLLDALPGVLGLREPLPLLELTGLALEAGHPLGRLSHERHAEGVRLAARLLARGFDDTRAVVVKPTSIAWALAPQWLAAAPGARAILLWIDLESWLAAMLSDAQLRADSRRQAAHRLAGWHALAGDGSLRLWRLDDAELLAMCWLTEQLRYREWARDPALAARLRALDFDDVLADPATALDDLARHFSLAASREAIAAAIESGQMGRYAKDTTRPYDARTRRGHLDAARAAYAAEIERGRAWARAQLDRIGGGPLPARLDRR
jgi:hypothetical protein